jgi:diadenosine tetraphosphatase ApaH/serine/threonine PP2A family protein phosphatase
MIIALLADIHGNREALSACLAHAEECNVGRYVFLGDYVGYGADPGWAVDEVMAYVDRGALAIMGNHDKAAISSSEQLNSTAQEAIEWTRTRLNDSQRKFLQGLPLVREVGTRLFVHANAWDPAGWDYVIGARQAEQSLSATNCGQTFCAHVHVPALYHSSATGKVGQFTPVAGVEIPLLVGRQWLAVMGSVGQPRDHNPAACYGLLDDERNVLTYLRVPYDTETAARKVRDAGLPLILSIRIERGY